MAIVMALAMVVVGNYFMPTSKIVDAETEWISVTGVPAEAGGVKDKYRLGTTSDTSNDGKWYLQVANNQWANWTGKYQNADGIEGFKFNDEVYNNRGGVFLWSADLKTEYDLDPGTSYDMSVTISYTSVNKAQHNYVLTEGGQTNMNISRTVAKGTSTETYTGEIKPRSDRDFVLRISWTSVAYETAEKGIFQVTDVTFTPKTPETTTAGPGDWIAVETGGVHDNAQKYTLGTKTDYSEDGEWSLKVGQNEWENWTGRYKYADLIEGFAFDSQVYHNGGGVYLWSSDLKDKYNLNANQTYKMSVTIGYTGVGLKDNPEEDPAPQHNFIKTGGGIDNMNESRTVAGGDSEETYTANVTPRDDQDFVLEIEWTDTDYYTSQKGMLEIIDVSFTDPETETVAPGDWISARALGEDYRLGTTSATSADGNWWLNTAQNEWENWTGRYKYADSFEGFTFDSQAYHNRGGVFLTSEDLLDEYNLVKGKKYNMSVTIDYTGVGLKDNPEEEPASQENTILTYGGIQNMNIKRVVAGGDSEETYEATVVPNNQDGEWDGFGLKILWATQDPENPDVYTTAEKGTIEVVDISFEQIGMDCEIGDWAFADAPGTAGWQYFVAGEGSTYSGGTSINDPLTINYGPYVAQDHACMARSPITSVAPGEMCTGSISITSEEKIAGSGNIPITNAALYAYNEDTDHYDWLANSDNAPDGQVVPANTKTTFNFTYEAPQTGKIIYILTTDYTPVTTMTFEATHEGPYDVSEYKPAGGPITYPTAQGKVFAGWFTDDTYTTPYMESTGYAYAKFIDADALTVKFQKANDGSAIRFVSSIDDYLDYQTVGFKFTGTYGNAVITEKTKTTNSLFTKITAAGESILPSVFSDDSAFFFTYTVRGMDANTDSTWNVTPFIVTADGTTVEGTEGSYPAD